MDILTLSPCFKDYLWGGNRLKRDFSFETDLEKVAEGWMLAAHKDGDCTVTNGKYKGKRISELFKEHPEIFGKNAQNFDRFPMLIKLIDAKDDLSVQVHPDNEYALSAENEYGKTEMWYIVDREENSRIYYGFKKEYSKEEIKDHIENGTLTEILDSVPVDRGDCFFIEAGTVHAIGKGILIAEIQQNSNTTYRVFDYERRDKNGNLRELHIKKALDVMTPSKPKTAVLHTGDGGAEPLFDCEFFTSVKRTVKGSIEINVDDRSFSSILVIEGSVTINGEKYKKGSSLLIAASSGSIIISGDAVLIESRI